MNIQTVPREDTVVKGSFYPKQDYLLFADYSQIEYRIWAWYMSQQVDDHRLVETFREGKDVHGETSRQIHEALGWDYTETDSTRQIGKTLNFAAIYGGGIPTVVDQLGCDRAQARAIVDGFHGTYPLLGRGEWRGRGFTDPPPETLNGMLVSTLRDRGYIRDLWGRELFPLEERKALNQLCQGGGADLMKKAMVTIARAIKKGGARSHLVLSVHDEVGIDGVDEERDWLVGNLPGWMGDDTLEAVLPVEVDMKLTRTSWAEAEAI